MSVEWTNTGWGYEQLELNESFFLVELNHLKKNEIYSKRDPIEAEAEGTLLI
jgi:hypothetical protein